MMGVFFIWLFVLMCSLAVTGLMYYAIVHFIIKFW